MLWETPRAELIQEGFLEEGGLSNLLREMKGR